MGNNQEQKKAEDAITHGEHPCGSIDFNEFSMLDFFLFRTAEDLCGTFARNNSSCHPWGECHVLLLGDPAQLPAVSRRDIFGTNLSRHFTVLLLREIKRAKDPVLASVLSMIRLGECGAEVDETLCKRLTEEKVDEIDLDKTVAICSTRVECADVNEQCLEKLH